MVEVRIRLFDHQHDRLHIVTLAEVPIRGQDELGGSCGDALVEWMQWARKLYMSKGEQTNVKSYFELEHSLSHSSIRCTSKPSAPTTCYPKYS